MLTGGNRVPLTNAAGVRVMCCFIQGLVDVAKEMTKLESKKEKLNGQLAKLREAMEIPDYETKVPDRVLSVKHSIQKRSEKRSENYINPTQVS